MARLYREQALGYRTQHAELVERTRAAGPLLPGTPGSLVERSASGRAYWYRVYSAVPGGRPVEDYVCKASDVDALEAMRARIDFAQWCEREVSLLRKLGYQAADKKSARVLVELHNRGLFEAGLVLVGTLAFAAWLNELGAVIPAPARTLDIDLARSDRLALATPVPLLESLRKTTLPFQPVPAFPSRAPSTSMKLPGSEGLRVDLLAPGRTLGEAIPAPDLEWAAQGVPFYDYLLAGAERGAALAGGQCIPVRLPRAGRFVCHKLFASTRRSGLRDKAVKDRGQALVLGAVLAESFPSELAQAFDDAPKAMIDPVRTLLPLLEEQSRDHPELVSELRSGLGRAPRGRRGRPVS